jgi:broad specificity phosphatase PhoE
MSDDQKWPDSLWLVRHGESAGNVARDAAEDAGLPMIDIATRDMDVPLSATGEDQARAFGQWLGQQPADEQPTVVQTSPYVRAEATARLALDAAGIADAEVTIDERLREREFGILDRLTRAGIVERFPEQAELRKFVGKFYHRPPGGESWCDVALRLRSVIDTMTRDHRNERVMIVSHQVVIMMFRYLLERMTEHQILETDREHQLANCSLTSFVFDKSAGRHGKLVLDRFNEVTGVVAQGAEVTREDDAPVAPR